MKINISTLAVFLVFVSNVSASTQRGIVNAPWILPYAAVLKNKSHYHPPTHISFKGMSGLSPRAKLDKLVKAYKKFPSEGQWLLSKVNPRHHSGPCLSMAVGLLTDIRAHKKELKCKVIFFSGDTKPEGLFPNEEELGKHAWLEVTFSNEPYKTYVVDPTKYSKLVAAEEYYLKEKVYPRYWFVDGQLRPAIR